MTRAIDNLRLSIRVEAERFLSQHDFTDPPLSPKEALAARKLEVTQYNLDDLLIEANLSPDDHQMIQAMLDQTAKAVTFRDGLAEPKRNWGSLHEVGHEFLPWQRELLYQCPLILMPPKIQQEFEVEADIFAAEAFFFGSQFKKAIREGDGSLDAAIDLADNLYETSRHATIRHYVEESDFPCCLIVWRPNNKIGDILAPRSVAVHYYVRSNTFEGHIKPGQIADPDDAVTKIFNDPLIVDVVDHELTIIHSSGHVSVANAQSFSNSYNVFTLIDQPVTKPLYVVALEN